MDLGKLIELAAEGGDNAGEKTRPSSRLSRDLGEAKGKDGDSGLTGRRAETEWSKSAREMAKDSFAAVGFGQTRNEIVAAAGYRFRQGISRATDQGASFKEMMREINGVVRKHSAGGS